MHSLAQNSRKGADPPPKQSCGVLHHGHSDEEMMGVEDRRDAGAGSRQYNLSKAWLSDARPALEEEDTVVEELRKSVANERSDRHSEGNKRPSVLLFRQ